MEEMNPSGEAMSRHTVLGAQARDLLLRQLQLHPNGQQLCYRQKLRQAAASKRLSSAMALQVPGSTRSGARAQQAVPLQDARLQAQDQHTQRCGADLCFPRRPSLVDAAQSSPEPWRRLQAGRKHRSVDLSTYCLQALAVSHQIPSTSRSLVSTPAWDPSASQGTTRPGPCCQSKGKTLPEMASVMIWPSPELMFKAAGNLSLAASWKHSSRRATDAYNNSDNGLDKSASL